MGMIAKTVTFAGVLMGSLCGATALTVEQAPVTERSAAVAWSISPSDVFAAAHSDEATELASVRHDISELVVSEKDAVVVWFSLNEMATRDFTAAVGAFASEADKNSSNGMWIPFIRSSLSTHKSQTWSNVQTSCKDEQSVNHQFTICAPKTDDTECVTPEQLGKAIEALMPLSKNVDIHFPSDVKNFESATVIDSAVSSVSSVFEQHLEQTLVVVLAGQHTPMPRQVSEAECASTILLAIEIAEAERREMQEVVIVLLVSSSPAILSGLLLSLFLVFAVGLYFCVLGDIRGQTEFVASYPFKGQQYD